MQSLLTGPRSHRTCLYGIPAEPAPLTTDAVGTVRVGATRVSLDTVVACFGEGLSAEEIVEQYPSLKLGEVYSVIGYYLKHRDEVDRYLAERDELAARIRAENESRFEPAGVRARLLARSRQGSEG